jgi:hypothetical protein
MNMSKKFTVVAIICIISLVLNLIFIVDYLNLPSYQLGVLRKDLYLDAFSADKKTIATLHKGMIVMDASPRFIASVGVFRPERISFTIMIDRNLVDYSQSANLSNGLSVYNSSGSNDK